MYLFRSSRMLMPVLVIICFQSTAQTGSDQKKQDQVAQLKTIIDSKQFYFHAQSATSTGGRTFQLTSEYGLTLYNDSLSADLPYYGRAYVSNYPGTDLSVQFTSNQFSYVSDSARKGGWDITIVPKNESKASKIIMSVGSSGYCTVQVISNSRQPISYYGTIRKTK
jgi:hypothetical protein